MTVLRRYDPGPALPVRRVSRPAGGRATPLLSRRCHIPVITDVIMGGECVKTVIMVTG